MAAWRRRALALFPELREELVEPGASLYSLGWALGDMVRAAYDTDNVAMLRRIYGFALWRLAQRGRTLLNPIGLGFYEHLLDRKCDWPDVLAWLPPGVISMMWPVWEYRLGSVPMKEVTKVLVEVRRSPGKLPWESVPLGGEERP